MEVTREDPDRAMGVQRRNLEEGMTVATMDHPRVNSAALQEVNSVALLKANSTAHLLVSTGITARHRATTVAHPPTVTATKDTPTSSSRAAGVRLAGTGRSFLRCSGHYCAHDWVETIPDLP